MSSCPGEQLPRLAIAQADICCVHCTTAAVVAAIHKYLDRVTLHGPITLDKLMQIENKIISDFHLAHFSSLDHGTFLEFVLTQPDISKVTHLCTSHCFYVLNVLYLYGLSVCLSLVA